MSDKNFYITSPIFYPNANLHMGHAYTMTLCDAIARHQKLVNKKEVLFLTGSDENTGKVVKAAEDSDVSVDIFLENITSGFRNLYTALGIDYDIFVRTTDKEDHWPGAIDMWQKLSATGDIYKSKYVGLYCPQCEAFYTEKELIEGKCPLHGIVPETLEEENYFFKLSKYTGEIKSRILSDELKISPETRKNEILALLDRGLEDVSFSRPASTVPHAIPVPNDPDQVMYVWCDALTSYITGVGFGTDDAAFNKWWPASVHVIGKDILRFHAAIWPAMLLSAGLPLPKELLVHGFILSGGQKMSKSRGNVVDPLDLITEYGAEAVRYYLLAKISPFEDGDLTLESFKNAYNGELANGLGNLVSRILTMAETYLDKPIAGAKLANSEEISRAMETHEVQKAMGHIWNEISGLDAYIQMNQPFKVIKVDPEQGKDQVLFLVKKLQEISFMLEPFLPETSLKIQQLIRENKKPETPLFVRKD